MVTLTVFTFFASLLLSAVGLILALGSMYQKFGYKSNKILAISNVILVASLFMFIGSSMIIGLYTPEDFTKEYRYDITHSTVFKR